jgi:hypothetical protein
MGPNYLQTCDTKSLTEVVPLNKDGTARVESMQNQGRQVMDRDVRRRKRRKAPEKSYFE